jgi:aminoglycoside phosphotransferase (APT) family kinase protein
VTVIRSSDQLDAEPAVRRVLVGIFGSSASVLSCERYSYETSSPLYAAQVATDTKVTNLIIKDSGRAALHNASHLSKPDFLCHPLREALVYREVLSDLPLATARFFGSVHDESLDHVYLVLERVAGAELWQSGDFDAWLHVAAQLARQHVLLGQSLSGKLAGAVPWIDYSARLGAVWLERAQRFNLDNAGVTKLLESAVRILPDCLGELYDVAPTVVHGDFYPSNVLLRTDSAMYGKVCPVDWEVAGLGPGLLDLASFVSGKWSHNAREALAMSYYEELSRLLENVPSRARFTRQLAIARMQTSIRWLGWSTDWAPPIEHQNDWALELEDSIRQLE